MGSGKYKKREWDEATARKIVDLYDKHKVSTPALSERFGASHKTIERILGGLTFPRVWSEPFRAGKRQGDAHIVPPSQLAMPKRKGHKGGHL